MKKAIWFSIILLFSVPVVSHSQGTLYLLGNGTDGSNSAVDVSVVYRAPRIAERVSFDDLKFAYINPFKDRSYTTSNLETVIQYAFGTNFFQQYEVLEIVRAFDKTGLGLFITYADKKVLKP